MICMFPNKLIRGNLSLKAWSFVACDGWFLWKQADSSEACRQAKVCFVVTPCLLRFSYLFCLWAATLTAEFIKWPNKSGLFLQTFDTSFAFIVRSVFGVLTCGKARSHLLQIDYAMAKAFLSACASLHRTQCSNRAMDFIHKAQVPNYAINVAIESWWFANYLI